MDLPTDAEHELIKAIAFDKKTGQTYCSTVKTCTFGSTCKDMEEVRCSLFEFRDHINHGGIHLRNPFASLVQHMCKTQIEA